jgi:hypothetical protein
MGDLGTALAPDSDVTASLRPFLILRILGVIPLRQMSGPHAVACLARLAELSRHDLTLHDWCACTPTAHADAAGQDGCEPGAQSATVAENQPKESR